MFPYPAPFHANTKTEYWLHRLPLPAGHLLCSYSRGCPLASLKKWGLSILLKERKIFVDLETGDKFNLQLQLAGIHNRSTLMNKCYLFSHIVKQNQVSPTPFNAEQSCGISVIPAFHILTSREGRKRSNKKYKHVTKAKKNRGHGR